MKRRDRRVWDSDGDDDDKEEEDVYDVDNDNSLDDECVCAGGKREDYTSYSRYDSVNYDYVSYYS